MENIGARIVYLLKSKGITAYELSDATGISQATLSRLINKNTKPNIENSKILSEYFNVSREWIINGTGEKELSKIDKNEYSSRVEDPGTIYENMSKLTEAKENPSPKGGENDSVVVSRLTKMLEDAYDEIKVLRQQLERKKNK